MGGLYDLRRLRHGGYRQRSEPDGRHRRAGHRGHHPRRLFYVAVSAWFNRSDLTVVSAALAGGLSAFLIYNFHPAKVFMGDTGSLFLGGAVCGLAFAWTSPWLSLWWD